MNPVRHDLFMAGPLNGYRIIEFAGIGPAPFAAMMLADMGADVIRIDRAGPTSPDRPVTDVMLRGRRSIAVNLKHPDGVAAVLRLVDTADGLVEGFRPGVMERLGLGPQECSDRNPKLVFGRMTGWGQDGPYAKAAGHDINYISLAGALAHIGRAGEGPTPPLNLVGDFGGGGMFLAFGMVCGILEAQRSGQGQVIDAAMVDGSASLMTFFWALKHAGMFNEDGRGTNLLDTGAHFYDVFECADGKYVSIGSIEPQFYAELLRLTDLSEDAEFARQFDVAMWPALKTRLRHVFAGKTQAAWCALMEHTDVCFAPVLTMSEAAAHPHNHERGTFIEHNGLMQPSPAPRFSRTAPALSVAPVRAGADTRDVLAGAGYSAVEVERLLADGAVSA
jgi:alpha-methylacyl-CoA racemase